MLNVVAFYDNAFKKGCLQLNTSPDDVIEQIFSIVGNLFKHESLNTKFHLNLIKKIYKDNVIWNNAKVNGTEQSLKRLTFYDEESADIYAYMGLMNPGDVTPTKVPKNGRCFSNNQTCSGVCSDQKFERTFVVECDIDNLPQTAYLITHEIGHLLGLPHDFFDSSEYHPYRRPKQSLLNPRTTCTTVNGIMDYGSEYNNLKWTECSKEYMRIYHQQAKDISTYNTFCLEPYINTTGKSRNCFQILVIYLT